MQCNTNKQGNIQKCSLQDLRGSTCFLAAMTSALLMAVRDRPSDLDLVAAAYQKLACLIEKAAFCAKNTTVKHSTRNEETKNLDLT